jgi:hypothetical protein
MIDETVDNATPNTATHRNISDQELQEFRAFRDNKLRAAALQEGQNMATTAHLADEAAADAAALAKLTSKQLSLEDAFGNRSTDRGRGLLINLHRGSFGKSSDYVRLRRMAASQGLVK